MQPIQILIVDDEERFVVSLATILVRYFGVFTAFDGAEALDRLSSQTDIAVALMDVRMPGMDGLETLRCIKQKHPDVEVIMLTGHATLEDGVEALRLGAFDYLQKPCDIEELRAKIESACSVEQIRRRPVLWPRTKAGDLLLTGFFPLLPEDTLDRALEIFSAYRDGRGARILFVTTAEGRVQGVIRRRFLLAALTREAVGEEITWPWLQQHPDRLAEHSVQAVMECEVAAVSPETSLSETARQMLCLRYDSIPVISGGAVIGIVRLQDVLRHLQAADGNDEIGSDREEGR